MNNFTLMKTVQRRDNANYPNDVFVFTDQQVISGGVATFNLTDDGTAGGNALFTNIFSIQATAEKNTATATDVPAASIKSVSGNLKQVLVNSIDGKVLVALGATMEFSPDGTNIYLTVIGN